MSATSVLKRLFTVKEYYLMYESGVFAHGERVELIRGEIIKMAAIGRRHSACIIRTTDVLTGKLGNQVLVSVQNPLTLDNTSEPEPDLKFYHGQNLSTLAFPDLSITVDEILG